MEVLVCRCCCRCPLRNSASGQHRCIVSLVSCQTPVQIDPRCVWSPSPVPQLHLVTNRANWLLLITQKWRMIWHHNITKKKEILQRRRTISRNRQISSPAMSLITQLSLRHQRKTLKNLAEELKHHRDTKVMSLLLKK